MEPVQIGRGDAQIPARVPQQMAAAMEPVQIGRGDRAMTVIPDGGHAAAMEPVQIGRGDSSPYHASASRSGSRNGARPDRTG